MIRNICIMLIVLFAATNAFAEKYFDMRFNQSLEYFKQNGIKSLTFTNYEYEFGVPKRIGEKLMEIKFNENYQITESIIFDDGEVDGKILNVYNVSGDTVQITKFDDEELEEHRIEFKYNDKGILSEKHYYDEDEHYMKDEFFYDDKGNLTEFKNYEDNELEYSLKYIFDEKNREIEWQKFDKKGIMEQKAISLYNDKGLKTDSTLFFEGEADIKAKYSYDDEGRLTSYTVHTGDGNLFSNREMKYDFEGQLIEERIYDSYNVMIEMYILSYEKDGQVKDIYKYGEREFLEEIWKFKYHLNGLIKHEQNLNKIEVPQNIRKYEYEPPQY
jgi:YD repeat-containing protein